MIFMKPSGTCLLETGSSINSFLQLRLLSAPVSVAAYWDLKMLQEMAFGFRLEIFTFSSILPHCTIFLDLGTSKVTLTGMRVPIEDFYEQTCL